MNDIIRYIIPVGIVLIQGAMGWVLWSLRREFLSRSEWAAEKSQLAEKQGELERRITETEHSLARVPGLPAVHELDLGVQALRGEIKALEVKVCGVRELLGRFVTVVERQEEYLKYGRVEK